MNLNKLPLIPRRIILGNPERAAMTISPDGKRLMWLAPLDGVLNIWVAPRQDPAAARVLTRDRGRGIRSCFWTHNKNLVLSLQDKDGDENWHLYAVELDSGNATNLTPFTGAQAQFKSRSAKHPDEVVVGLNHRDAQWHDIYRINIVTGELSLLLQHDRFMAVVVDNELRLRLGVEMTANGDQIIHQLRDGEWQPWEEVPRDDFFSSGVIGFDSSNETLLMRDSRDRNTSAVVAIDLASNERRVLASDTRADVDGVLRHPVTRQVQAASFNYQRKQWQIVDPEIEADIARLQQLSEGDIHVTSRSRDDRFWTVVAVLDDSPARFYLYDRQKSSTTFLCSSQPALENLTLAKMNSTVVKARDGLEMVAYFSLPPGTACNKKGFPEKPLPMVFIPHGGPWYRDYWQFHPWHQWLANRGYAVVAVNFRASSGYGKDFINAGDREWGGKIIEDQQDTVRWAVQAGIADPGRMAVMGGSFGGYSTLAGLAFTPELFSCGVDLVGPVNLITWIESIPAYWKPFQNRFFEKVGDPRNAKGRALLEKHSPVNYADRICRPLLVVQGANDPRVRPAESEQIVQAMQANGVPVIYAYYPDEGHGIVRMQNNQSFHAMVEAFLARHIGGRLEPIENGFSGSSVELRTGVDQIPGLAEALAARDEDESPRDS